MVSASIKTGARFTLQRTAFSEAEARYEVLVEAPDQAWTLQFAIAAVSGELTVDKPDGDPPEWMDKYVQKLVRQAARSGVRDGVWPRKLSEWRPAPSSPSQGF